MIDYKIHEFSIMTFEQIESLPSVWFLISFFQETISFILNLTTFTRFLIPVSSSLSKK